MGDGLELRSFAALEPGERRGHALCPAPRMKCRKIAATNFIKVRMESWTNHVNAFAETE